MSGKGFGKPAKVPDPTAPAWRPEVERARQCYTQGRWQQAAAGYRRILERQPDQPEALVGLGLSLRQLGDPEAACTYFERAAGRWPQWVEAHQLLAATRLAIGQYALAEASCRRALALKPANADVLYDLGMALLEQARPHEAEVAFAEALAARPGWGAARCRLGLIRMLTGNLELGLTDYEARHQLPSHAGLYRPEPLWDGAPLAGRSLFVQAEGGYGDLIQFVRYAPLVQQKGGRVIFGCYSGLKSLLATCAGIDAVIESGEAIPPCDLRALAMSLPLLCGPEAIPAGVPYLKAPPGSSLPILETGDQLRVGLCWCPGMFGPEDYKRYCPLEQLAPLFSLPQVRFYSLYKGDRAAELAPFRDRVSDLGSQFADFADTARAIAELDLVVSVDTAVAHLAAALGKPTWILLPAVPDWRWFLDRSDSPWYPTARLFRQPHPGAWEPVIAEVRQALGEAPGRAG